MKSLNFDSNIDTAIRFFIYVLIFWIPYSAAVIETCVIISSILWLVKRARRVDWTFKKNKPDEIFENFVSAFSPKSNQLNKPIGFFLLVCFISIATSNTSLASLSAFVTKTFEWFVVFILVVEVFNTRKQFLIALGIFLFTSFSTALDGIVQYHLTGVDIFNGREITRGGATAGFHHANSLGGYLAAALPISFSLLLVKEKVPWQRPLAILIFVILLWCLVVTFSRAAIVAAALGTASIAFILKRKQLKEIFGILFAFLICIVLLIPSNVKTNLRVTSNVINETIEWRSKIWYDSLIMAAHKPVFGHGPNTFMELFQDYRRKEHNYFDQSPTYAHNGYIQILAELGILGLGAFLWILVVIYRLLNKTIDRIKAKNEGILLGGFLAGVSACLVHSFFDTNFYALQLSVYLWLLIGFMTSFVLSLNKA